MQLFLGMCHSSANTLEHFKSLRITYYSKISRIKIPKCTRIPCFVPSTLESNHRGLMCNVSSRKIPEHCLSSTFSLFKTISLWFSVCDSLTGIDKAWPCLGDVHLKHITNTCNEILISVWGLKKPPETVNFL